MGGIGSKMNKRKNKKTVKKHGKKSKVEELPPVTPPPRPDKNVKSTASDEEVLDKLRKHLREDAETFILNNLFYSVQFFENFDRDISILQSKNVSKKENQINTRLRDQQKHCLLPDTLHEVVNKNVRFQPMHGSNKHISEPLHSNRIIVVYDNIEVLNPEESADYSSALDGPIYKCELEPTQLNGYVMLKIKDIEYIKKKAFESQNIFKKESEDATRTQNISQRKKIDLPLLSIGNSFLEEVKKRAELPPKSPFIPSFQAGLVTPSVENPPRSPTSSTSSSMIGLVTPSIDRMNIFGPQFPEKDSKNIPLTPTERRLSGIRLKPELRRSFSIRSVFVRQIEPTIEEHGEDMMRESGDETDSSEYGYSTINNEYTPKPLEQMRFGQNHYNPSILPENCITPIECKNLSDYESGELFATKEYLNSIVFVASFGDLFAGSNLNDSLGFNRQIVEKSMMQGAIIYSDKIENGHNVNYETIPTVTSSWPHAAIEWYLRKRDAVFGFRWPTRVMIDRVRKMHCHLYPTGFVPKRGENINRPLQWRLAFPAAERYLETCLTHSQIKCYQLLLAFYKSFIEPKSSKLGITADHIRSQIFWECERNCYTWPEERLGEKLFLIIRNLYNNIRDQKLPDYFIKDRNLFENIPTTNLIIAQKKIHDIIENPVMFSLIALRNMIYSKKFYPVLDYKRLYRIIMTDNVPSIMNPQIPEFVTNDEAYSSDDSDEYTDQERGFWESKRLNDPSVQWNRRLIQRIRNERNKNNQQKNETILIASTDSINTTVKPIRRMEEMRRILILQLFIPHFMAMAKKSYEYNAISQGIQYIKHTEKLNILLREEGPLVEEADKNQVQIDRIYENLKAAHRKPKTPSVPPRNEFAFGEGSVKTTMSKPQRLFGKDVSQRKDYDYENIDLEDFAKSRPGTIKFTADVHENKNIFDIEFKHYLGNTSDFAGVPLEGTKH